MTSITLQGRRLVKHHRFFADEFRKRVALLTFHTRMAARQRHLCSLVVIERRRNPALCVVAGFARRFARVIFELAAVRFSVAGLAIRRGPFKLNFLLAERYLVARAAVHRAMRTEKRKLRFRMIEARYVSPGLDVVACFATKRRTARPLPLHSVLELSVMRIFVARRARHIVKMERKNLVATVSLADGVTIGARYSSMRARQRES